MRPSVESSYPYVYGKAFVWSTSAAYVGGTMGGVASLGLMALTITAAIVNPATGPIALAVCAVLFGSTICALIGFVGSYLIGLPLFFILEALEQGITNLHPTIEPIDVQCFSTFTSFIGGVSGGGVGIYLMALSISAALVNPATGPIMLAAAACLFSIQFGAIAGKYLGGIAGLTLSGIVSGCCSCLFGGGRVSSRLHYERGLDLDFEQQPLLKRSISTTT